MRNWQNLRRAGTVLMSVGLATLLIVGFLALGAVGLGSQGAAAQGPDEDNNGHVGGNAGNTHFETGIDVVDGITITTRDQNGPERVCVEHFVDGVLNNTNFLPINSDVVKDVLAAANHTRVRGNEWWQLCAAGTATTTTTVESTTTHGPERVCVEHFVDGRFIDQQFLPINSDVVQDILADPNHTRIRGNELWQLCGLTTTTTTTTVEETTTTTEETTTTTTTETTTTATEAEETTTTGTTTTTVAPTTAATTETTTVAPTTTTTEVVTTQTTTVAPTTATTTVAPTTTTTVAGVVALPRAGGAPFPTEALAGLGLLLSGAGAALRRLIR